MTSASRWWRIFFGTTALQRDDARSATRTTGDFLWDDFQKVSTMVVTSDERRQRILSYTSSILDTHRGVVLRGSSMLVFHEFLRRRGFYHEKLEIEEKIDSVHQTTVVPLLKFPIQADNV